MSITEEEIAKFEQCLENPEFKKSFDEHYRGPEASDRCDYVFPTPGFVIKTKDVQTNQKVFINVCQHKKVRTFASEPDPNNEDQERIRVPLSMGPSRDVLDKAGKASLVYDCIMNPDVIAASTKDQSFREFIVMLCMQWVEQKAGGKLDEKYTLPKVKYKGEVTLQGIRASALVQEMGQEDPQEQQPETREAPSRGRPTPGPFSSSAASVAAAAAYPTSSSSSVSVTNDEDGASYSLLAIPHYVATIQRPSGEELEIHRSATRSLQKPWADYLPKIDRGDCFVLTMELPAVDFSGQVDLRICDDHLSLKVYKTYHLELPLPYTVDTDNGDATFNTDTHELTVFFPVAPADIPATPPAKTDSKQRKKNQKKKNAPAPTMAPNSATACAAETEDTPTATTVAATPATSATDAATNEVSATTGAPATHAVSPLSQTTADFVGPLPDLRLPRGLRALEVSNSLAFRLV